MLLLPILFIVSLFASLAHGPRPSAPPVELLTLEEYRAILRRRQAAARRVKLINAPQSTSEASTTDKNYLPPPTSSCSSSSSPELSSSLTPPTTDETFENGGDDGEAKATVTRLQKIIQLAWLVIVFLVNLLLFVPTWLLPDPVGFTAVSTHVAWWTTVFCGFFVFGWAAYHYLAPSDWDLYDLVQRIRTIILGGRENAQEAGRDVAGPGADAAGAENANEAQNPIDWVLNGLGRDDQLVVLQGEGDWEAEPRAADGALWINVAGRPIDQELQDFEVAAQDQGGIHPDINQQGNDVLEDDELARQLDVPALANVLGDAIAVNNHAPLEEAELWGEIEAQEPVHEAEANEQQVEDWEPKDLLALEEALLAFDVGEDHGDEFHRMMKHFRCLEKLLLACDIFASANDQLWLPRDLFRVGQEKPQVDHLKEAMKHFRLAEKAILAFDIFGGNGDELLGDLFELDLDGVPEGDSEEVDIEDLVNRHPTTLNDVQPHDFAVAAEVVEADDFFNEELEAFDDDDDDDKWMYNWIYDWLGEGVEVVDEFNPRVNIGGSVPELFVPAPPADFAQSSTSFTPPGSHSFIRFGQGIRQYHSPNLPPPVDHPPPVTQTQDVLFESPPQGSPAVFIAGKRPRPLSPAPSPANSQPSAKALGKRRAVPSEDSSINDNEEATPQLTPQATPPATPPVDPFAPSTSKLHPLVKIALADLAKSFGAQFDFSNFSGHQRASSGNVALGLQRASIRLRRMEGEAETRRARTVSGPV